MQLAVPESPAKEACHPSDRWILEAPGDLPAVAAAVPAAAELAFVAIETAATANVGVCNLSTSALPRNEIDMDKGK